MRICEHWQDVDNGELRCPHTVEFICLHLPNHRIIYMTFDRETLAKYNHLTFFLCGVRFGWPYYLAPDVQLPCVSVVWTVFSQPYTRKRPHRGKGFLIIVDPVLIAHHLRSPSTHTGPSMRAQTHSTIVHTYVIYTHSVAFQKHSVNKVIRLQIYVIMAISAKQRNNWVKIGARVCVFLLRWSHLHVVFFVVI